MKLVTYSRKAIYVRQLPNQTRLYVICFKCLVLDSGADSTFHRCSEEACF